MYRVGMVGVVRIAFVEKKSPNMARIAGLLEKSAQANFWANRGPVYQELQDRFAEHLGLDARLVPVPVANGGVALEAMARLHAARAGRKLRWVGSTYSFQNLGRGYFSDMSFVDCDAGGLISLEALGALDLESYDGIVVTNPFGLYTDFSALASFAKSSGKVLLIDNASGVHTKVPDLPWQAFSLHHTKPYGMGEGGLALVPRDAAEELYALVNYGAEISDELRPHWFENGKLSDISAAFLIDRLDQLSDWALPALEQRQRIIRIARDFDLMPLAMPETDIPLTSMPFLAKAPVPEAVIDQTKYATYAKYYRPLAPLPCVADLYSRLVNVPCHRDMAELSDAQVAEDMESCVSPKRVRVLKPRRSYAPLVSKPRLRVQGAGS